MTKSGQQNLAYGRIKFNLCPFTWIKLHSVCKKFGTKKGRKSRWQCVNVGTLTFHKLSTHPNFISLFFEAALLWYLQTPVPSKDISQRKRTHNPRHIRHFLNFQNSLNSLLTKKERQLMISTTKNYFHWKI